jgi:hypothetical protein
VPDHVHGRDKPQDDPRVAVEHAEPDGWPSSVGARAMGFYNVLKRTHHDWTLKPTAPQAKRRGRQPRTPEGR